jgi:molecular chaperone GrpE (heat shock protein)
LYQPNETEFQHQIEYFNKDLNPSESEFSEIAPEYEKVSKYTERKQKYIRKKIFHKIINESLTSISLSRQNSNECSLIDINHYHK